MEFILAGSKLYQAAMTFADKQIRFFFSPLEPYLYIHPVKYIVYYISRTTYIQKYRLIYPLVLFRNYNIRTKGELKKGNLTKTNVYTVEDLKAS